MKYFIMGVVVGLIITATLSVFASNIGVESIFNLVFDSTNNVLNVKGV